MPQDNRKRFYQATPEAQALEVLHVALCYRLNGLLTVYYPEGMDIIPFGLKNPKQAVEKLAREIGQPVQFVIGSRSLGNVSQIYFPDNFDGGMFLYLPPQEMARGSWTGPFSQRERRFLNADEVKRDMLFSGAPNHDPVYLLDVGVGMDKNNIRAKMAALHQKTGIEVVCDLNGIVRSSALIGKQGGPVRPEDRKLAETLGHFKNGLPDYAELNA